MHVSGGSQSRYGYISCVDSRQVDDGKLQGKFFNFVVVQ